MAFANLFTRLSAVVEDGRSPSQAAFKHRDEPENGKRGNARKRKPQAEQTGPYKKKQFHQAQTPRGNHATSFRDKGVKAMHYNMHKTQSENQITKGQNYRTKNNHNGRKQQQQQQQQKKKPESQTNQHQQRDRWTAANRGGGHQSRPAWGEGGGDGEYKNNKQEDHVQRPRFMTDEFKDHNGVLVNGRLVCRHFLFGRCIKGDTCQLEHIQGYNDVVKEVCKFYVQGSCTKGESCPYMHKSFPCKFFHRRGRCSQEEQCRFSHEPLNDITTKLLDKALQKENDLREQTKKSEQETLGPTEDSEIIEAEGTPDIPLQPLKLFFYNSVEANTEKETTLCATEALANEAAVPPYAPEAAQHHPAQSSYLNPAEAVCHSVEAVLGPQLFKPFPRLFTTPEESGSANQKEVPYSVNAVLSACKSTLPIVQTVSYTPKTDREEITYPLLSSETPNKKVLNSENARNEVNKSGMFKSLNVHTGLVSKTCPSLTPAYRDYSQQGAYTQKSLKPAQRTAHGSTSHKSILPRPSNNSPKQPAQLRPHISVLTPESQASVRSSPSSSFTRSKVGFAATVPPVTSSIYTTDSTNSVCCHSAAKHLPLPSKNTQSGLKRGTHCSTEITAECSSKMSHGTDVDVGCKKALRRPFHSLSESTITVTTSSCPQSSPPESADRVKSVFEMEKASARSFLSLFAAPLGAAQTGDVKTSSGSEKTINNETNSKQSTFKSKKHLLNQFVNAVKEIPDVSRSPNPKLEKKDSSLAHIDQPTKQKLAPVCGLVSNSTHARQQLPAISSHKGSAVASSASSVLKNLFLSLSPYQQDAEPQGE